MYSLKEDNRFVTELIRYASALQWLEKEMISVKDSTIFIYGASYRGRLVANIYSALCAVCNR